MKTKKKVITTKETKMTKASPTCFRSVPAEGRSLPVGRGAKAQEADSKEWLVVDDLKIDHRMSSP